MVHLTLAGLSDDGKRLLLVSDQGVEFTLDADERLRAALRGDHARLGQLEITMDSTLRPRDIQARIRAGESPEAVAQAAQTSVDKIMPFAAPVMAERQHVAQRAQRSSVRRTGQTGGARTLGDAVAAHLRGANVDPDGVEWDAARREDGRWALTAEFATPARSGHRASSPTTPPATTSWPTTTTRGWLLGDLREPAAAPRPGDDLTRARARRLSAVSDSRAAARRRRDRAGHRRRAARHEQPVEALLRGARPSRPRPRGRADGGRPREEPDRRGAGGSDEPDSEEDPTPEEPPARRPPRSAAAPRSRAGTRSCSAAGEAAS